MNPSTEPNSDSKKSTRSPEHGNGQNFNKKPHLHSNEQRQDPQQHRLPSSANQYEDDNLVDEIKSALLTNRDFRSDCRANRGRKYRNRIFDLLKVPEFKKRLEKPPNYKIQNLNNRPTKNPKIGKKEAKRAEKKLVKEMKKLSTK
uniref:Uncharacterized protein n=1 Tax=Panagrellus redivivus TaxID=6233 RepID=A0A7E4UUY4_PANRE